MSLGRLFDHISALNFDDKISGFRRSPEAIASRAVIVIISGSDGRVKTLLEPAK